MESIWSKETQILPKEPLHQHQSVNTVIIGGGMAGILTAFLLKKRGVDVVVLEANTIGSGQTKNTTAKITCQHGLMYYKLIQERGEHYAKKYARVNMLAIELYERIINSLHIDCDFRRLPSYLYSKVDDLCLRREAGAASKLGMQADFCFKTALPFEVKGAVRFENQAQFQPLAFLKAISEEVCVYEHSPVLKVESNTVITPGGNVKADHVVFATHYPFVNFPGLFFTRLHQERSYAIAIEGGQNLEGLYYGVDKDGISFRNAGSLTILGGGNHRTGENSQGGKYQFLQDAAKRFYPDCTLVAQWSAQDCIPIDGLPYIGRFGGKDRKWYVATGFFKWGMTNSMVSAMVLCDMICGVHNRYGDMFDPNRNSWTKSVKNLSIELKASVLGLGRQVFSDAKSPLSSLPQGHGGIVEWKGHKLGAYKDEQGNVFLVSVKCPHLGCQLEWNPDEKSWDCPCHGSRFDYTGALLDNPAQIKLKAYRYTRR
jgi:glycine/D-amino acid oxidase-like deaminating enzyme/nitrite reductase/ring-hydroxylating ferredoxin subunit